MTSVSLTVKKSVIFHVKHLTLPSSRQLTTSTFRTVARHRQQLHTCKGWPHIASSTRLTTPSRPCCRGQRGAGSCSSPQGCPVSRSSVLGPLQSTQENSLQPHSLIPLRGTCFTSILLSSKFCQVISGSVWCSNQRAHSQRHVHPEEADCKWTQSVRCGTNLDPFNWHCLSFLSLLLNQLFLKSTKTRSRFSYDCFPCDYYSNSVVLYSSSWQICNILITLGAT